MGNLENFGVLKNSLRRNQSECVEPVEKKEKDVLAVIEFGAGRGYLTQMLADCYGIKKVFLVERKAYKLKVGHKLLGKVIIIKCSYFQQVLNHDNISRYS